METQGSFSFFSLLNKKTIGLRAHLSTYGDQRPDENYSSEPLSHSWSPARACTVGQKKNLDCSTGPLAHLFTRSLALLTCSLAPHCSLCSAHFARALCCGHFALSFARGKVNDYITLYRCVFLSILDHSAFSEPGPGMEESITRTCYLSRVRDQKKRGAAVDFCQNKS